jgi:excisionase family DNA binding protein
MTDTDTIRSRDLEDLPALITPKEAARLAGHSYHWVTDELARGRIAGAKMGGRWRVNTAALLRQLGLGGE